MLKLWPVTIAALLSLLSLQPAAVRAETRTATSLTPEAVWEAINAAKDGDTVELPAGTAVWSKGWNTGHGAKMKAITIQGAGIDKTIICDNRPKPDAALFFLIGVEGKPFRVTGVTFDGTGYPFAGTWGGFIAIQGTCKNFRLDHCKFRNADRMITIKPSGNGDTYGLIDHCHFDGPESHGGNVQPIDFSGPGLPNYRKPLALGTDQAMYFEDNEIHIGAFAGTNRTRTGNNPWIAPNNGARVVIRHNKLFNSQLEIYRPGVIKGYYGCQTSEIYDNEFDIEGEGRPQGFIFIGAGVAIVFNNTVTGTGYNIRTIELRNERAWRDLPGFPKADGTDPLDGNQIPAGQLGAGHPCFGQVGWATDADGDGKFEPSPCYAWNNTLNGKPLRMEVSRRADANEAATIKEGREFFNEKPSEEHYRPYVYPHPLQEGWEVLMKSVVAPGAGSDTPTTTPPGSKP
jgi:hypothetical protein